MSTTARGPALRQSGFRLVGEQHDGSTAAVVLDGGRASRATRRRPTPRRRRVPSRTSVSRSLLASSAHRVEAAAHAAALPPRRRRTPTSPCPPARRGGRHRAGRSTGRSRRERVGEGCEPHRACSARSAANRSGSTVTPRTGAGRRARRRARRRQCGRWRTA